MKAQLEETVDAAMKVGLRRDESMEEDALRRGEDYLRLTIDTIPVLAWCARPDGSTEFLNQRWLDYTGLTIEEARGWGWKVAIHPDDLPQLLNVWQGLLDSGRSGELEARLRRADGVYRWFLSAMSIRILSASRLTPINIRLLRRQLRQKPAGLPVANCARCHP